MKRYWIFLAGLWWFFQRKCSDKPTKQRQRCCPIVSISNHCHLWSYYSTSLTQQLGYFFDFFHHNWFFRQTLTFRACVLIFSMFGWFSKWHKLKWGTNKFVEFVYCTAAGHGNKLELIRSNFNFEWTKFQFSKNRNKFESVFSILN